MMKYSSMPAVLLCAILLSANPVPAEQSLSEKELRREVQNTVESARLVFGILQRRSGQDIPASQLRDAAGVVIIPDAFLSGVAPRSNQGTGVLLAKSGDQWSLPLIVSLTSGNAGDKVELRELDLLIVIKNESDVRKIIQGRSLSLGGDSSAMAGGEKESKGKKKSAEVIVSAYQSSEARPEFSGVMPKGSSLKLQDLLTMVYYQIDGSVLRGYYQGEGAQEGTDGQGWGMLDGQASQLRNVPYSAIALRQALNRATSPESERQDSQDKPYQHNHRHEVFRF